MAKKVTTIPATLNRYSKEPVNSIKKRRVAGYGRVSTDTEEQQTSYEAQVDYYTTYIQRRDDWEFVGMYTDEGITGTSTKRREGFKEMVEDALAGKIDLILTKSISRFARNTVDSLVTVRKLKEKGVEIYFEKENIWTLDAKGELLITIMSSLAQEESRSISENTTWGKRKAFADGKVSIGFKNFLGYDMGPKGEFVINPEQAKVVELIYRLFLEGCSAYRIAKRLTELKIKTPMGKEVWQRSTILSILTNEKYKGDALLQKNYTIDFLTKKRQKNCGEIPQYYVEGHHEAIISKETFEAVQADLKRRKSIGKYSGVGVFSSIIKCGECGGWYGAKVWHSNDKYRRVVYECNQKYKKRCHCPHLTEDEIKSRFIRAVNELISEKDELLENTRVMMERFCNTTDLEEQQQTVQDEMEAIISKIQNGISRNSLVAQDQEAYNREYNRLVEKHELMKSRYDEITEQIENKKTQRERFRWFILTMEKQSQPIGEFDKALWSNLMDYVTVYSKKDIRFTFKNGIDISA